MKKRNIKVKLLTGVLAMTLAASQFPMNLAFAVNENEDSSSENAVSQNVVADFEINNADDFLAFAENCRKNSWSKGKVIKLNADIDLYGKDFEGIPSFSGDFDGNGHAISNLSIASGDEAVGLFRYLETDGQVCNLTVSGFIMSSDSRDLVGGIVGVNSGTIINCTFKGQITGLNVAGGITGLNGGSGRIVDCYNEGFITSQTNVGGIAGINRGLVSDCVNNGNVNSDSSWVDNEIENENTDKNVFDGLLESGKNIGGVCGWSNGIIATCENNGTVGYYKTGENVGGIVGCQSGSVFYCKNYGHVYGKQDVGGIAGQFEPTIVIRDIQEIKDEMDILHEMLDDSTNDIDKATDKLSSDLDKLNDNSDKITDYADIVSDEGLDNLDINTDVANDLSDRADYVSRHLEPINKYISNALDDMEELNKVLDKMEDDVEMSKDDKDKIKKSRESINSSVKKMKTASDEANKHLEVISDMYDDALEEGTKVADEKDAKTPGGLSDEEYSKEKAKATWKALIENDEFSDEMMDLMDALIDAMSAATDITADMTDISNVVGPYIDDSSDALSDDLEKANKLSKHILESFSDASDDTGAVLNYLNSYDKLELINFSDSFDKNFQSLQDEAKDTIKTMDTLNSDASKHSDILEEDMRKINDQMKVVTDLVIDRLSSLETVASGEDIIVDVSKDDKEGNASSSITGCTNKGNVDGNNNVGGIVGSIGIDNLDDKNSGLGSRYEVSAVLLSSINTGFITVKNKNAGGIIGYAVAGYIADCLSSGGIISEEGNYLGGIAGNCQGYIDSCKSLSVLSGNEYLGGIAGVADDVTNCLSMPMIMESKGRVGAVIGAYQSDDDDITVYHQGMSDHISNNYFVSEELFGIDNVSYLGVAEPIEYDDLCDRAYEFKTIRIYFVDEDYNLVDDRSYLYGQSLENLQYPSYATENGTYAEWEMLEDAEIKTNKVVRCVVAKNVTVLSSIQKENGKALALAEGVFTKQAELNVIKEETSSDNKKTVAQYSITLNNANISSEQEVNIRLLQETEGNAVIYQSVDGVLTKMPAEKIGSYWQIRMTGDNITVIMEVTKANEMLIFYIAGGAILLVIIVAAIIIAGKKKKKKA